MRQPYRLCTRAACSDRTAPPPRAQLDAGVAEQVLLMSRDEQSMLVASYADIKVGAG